MSEAPGPRASRLVLVGLGHSHLFVLEAARHGAFGGIDIVVCTADTEHLYSGMLPGWIRGYYSHHAVALPVEAMVVAAGARLIAQRAMGLSSDARAVILADGTAVDADVISIAVGSIPTGGDLPGVREHAVGVKPFARLAEMTAQIARGAVRHAVVVGGGVAGTELTLALRHAVAPAPIRVTIVTRDPSLALERGRRVSAMAQAACQRAGVQIMASADVLGAEPGAVLVRRGGDVERVAGDVLLWATGPAASPWLATTPLQVDEAGFVLVDDHLRSVSHPWVHAAGDCATMQSAPMRPRAGVFAVRMGPALVRSLRMALGLSPHAAPYRPQQRWLSLLDTSDGGAIAQWGPLVAEGKWAMRLKRWIDTRFVERFRPTVR